MSDVIESFNTTRVNPLAIQIMIDADTKTNRKCGVL